MKTYLKSYRDAYGSLLDIINTIEHKLNFYFTVNECQFITVWYEIKMIDHEETQHDPQTHSTANNINTKHSQQSDTHTNTHSRYMFIYDNVM